MFRNIVLDYDANDNIKPNKAKSANKIDGVSASAMSIFAWLTQPAPVSSYLLDSDLLTM
jgi:phage terminase large subunit-like protein